MRTLTPQPTLVDQVYESILTEITEGRLGPDSRLIQEELAETLGVSRQPVQQALLLLRSRGLLRDAPGRGLMVALLDPAHVRDLLEVRAMLDGLASAKVAEVAANIAKKEGPPYLARSRTAVKNRSIAQMTIADMEFHYFLYRLSGNPLIGEICSPHWSYFRRVMAEVLRGETPDEIWDQHEAILNAIIEGEAAKAERIARHHNIAHASEELAGRLEQHLNQNKQPAVKNVRRVNRAA